MPIKYILGNYMSSSLLSGLIEAVTFTGGGLNDCTSGGAYTGLGSKDFRVEIDASAPSPDTFKWSRDGGANWVAEDVPITAGVAQDLENGVRITFAAGDGHTIGDRWDFVAGNVSSEDTVYVKEHLYNKRQSAPFRFTGEGVVGNPEWIKMDAGAGMQPTAIGIMNHNLVGTGDFSLVLRAHNTNPPAGGWLAGAVYNKALTWNALNIWSVLAPGAAYRYWRLDVIDPNNTIAEIGELVIHLSGTFTRNYNWGYLEGTSYTKADDVTHYGQRWRAYLSKRKRFLLLFENFTDANLIAEAEAFFEGVDGTLPLVFIPDDGEAKCWYVVCLNNLEAERAFHDINNFELELEEQVRGITLL